MAEPLKNQFGAEIPRKIGRMIAQVSADFDQQAFVDDALNGYEALDLMARGRKIARTLHTYLPDDYPTAIKILLASAGPKLDGSEAPGMAPFLYLPHVYYVADYGLAHFEASMTAQYELTQRFTAEFSIRPFLERYPEACLARLRAWACDPNEHVRRLVSEGTRPRLPWASRLREFQKDPSPVLALLELLKDDSSLYVRRSVANNLNDIGKDHPNLLAETTRRWLIKASDERRWLIRHALRSAVKRAEPGALAVMGFGENAKVSVTNASITPRQAVMGDKLTIVFDITHTGTKKQPILVDFRIHFIKSNGKTSPKVFKLKTVTLAPQETATLRKTVSLAAMSTRKHYPGTHRVDVVINGVAQALGAFELAPE